MLNASRGARSSYRPDMAPAEYRKKSRKLKTPEEENRMKAVSITWLRISILLVLGGTAFQGAWAQEELSIQQLLRQCRRNINSSPIDGQRSCREALFKIRLDPFLPYQDEKIQAFTLLGESYYKLGRIADAVAQFDSVLVLTGEDEDANRDARDYKEQIDRLVRPLRIKIKNRDIRLLSYIKGIDIEFRYPQRLERSQINRLRILQDTQSHREDEFKFVGIDETDNRAYMELDYFPLITFPGRSMGYSLIVDGKRRYRFNFTPTENQPLEIIWPDEADWTLIERVPEDMVKMELPGKYSFEPDLNSLSDGYIAVDGENIMHIYLPARNGAVLTLEESEERNWERIYRLTLYGATGLAALIGLMGAR